MPKRGKPTAPSLLRRTIAGGFDPIPFLIAIFLAATKKMILGFPVIGREGLAMMGKALGSRPQQVP